MQTRFRIPENLNGFPRQSRVRSFYLCGLYYHSLSNVQEPLSRRPLSYTEDIPKAEPTQMEKFLTPPTPTVVAADSNGAKSQTELAPGEKLVSYVYCRICRRDPCRQPAATMCGHVFCYQCVPAVSQFLLVLLTVVVRCISSEVVKTPQCPVCEAPTLLYSIFRLHLH